MPNLYRILQKPVGRGRLGTYAGYVGDFDQVVGYSSLGHAFLRNSRSGEFAVLHPFRSAMKNYGAFGSAEEFEEVILRDEGFQEYVLRPAHVAQLENRLGPLQEGRVYIPCPYPFLGGSDAVDTYDTGDFWVFVEIVAQSLGLK